MTSKTHSDYNPFADLSLPDLLAKRAEIQAELGRNKENETVVEQTWRDGILSDELYVLEDTMKKSGV